MADVAVAAGTFLEIFYGDAIWLPQKVGQYVERFRELKR